MKLKEIFCETLKQDLNTLLENRLSHCGMYLEKPISEISYLLLKYESRHLSR